MSHGFARIFTDHHGLGAVHSLVMDRLPTKLKHIVFDCERKNIRENPGESVARVFA